MTDHRKLIEVTLPLEAISKAGAREKSIQHGHPNTLHMWWARQPLSVMRAAIFASLVAAPNNETETKQLEDLISTISNWDLIKENSKELEKTKDLIRQNFPEEPPKLLDPFMGSGTTGLESLRLGCETYAVELNPVAHLIELCTLVYPQKYREMEAGSDQLSKEIKKWGSWVSNQVHNEIGYLYKNPISDETIEGFLWARTVSCPNPQCGTTIPLVQNWWLSRKPNKKLALRPISHQNSDVISFEIVKGKMDFDPNKGTIFRGKIQCPVCQTNSPKQVSTHSEANYIRQEALRGRMGEIPLVVIYQNESKQKNYRLFSDDDLAIFIKAINESVNYQHNFPDEMVSNELAITRYGFSQWGDFFNDRQRIALVAFSQNIKSAHKKMIVEGLSEEKAKIITTYLGLCLDHLASRTSTLCKWRERQEAISSIFMIPDFWMSWNFVESNPLRPNSYWDLALNRIAKLTTQLNLTADQKVIVKQGTALDLEYPDEYFDAIITDPPYYDNVKYATLSDYFFVWLKRSIGFLYPNIFHTSLTPKQNEIFGKDKKHQHKNSSYEKLLLPALQEIERTLKPEGFFTQIYPYRSKTAFVTILDLLLKAGFTIISTWPIRTDRRVSLRDNDETHPSSILLFCKKRKKEQYPGEIIRVRAMMRHRIREQLGFFQEKKIPISDYFSCAIGPAIEVFGQYKNVTRDGNNPVNLSEIMDIIQEEVLEFTLVQNHIKTHGSFH